jgi:Na+-driven multidrug efflux pump
MSQWIVIGLSLIYGAIIFGIVGYAIADPLLGLFDITSSLPYIANAHLVLRVAILQMPMIAVGIGGMMMFQSTGR